MGALPNLSVIKGPTRQIQDASLNRLFEDVATNAAPNNIALIFEGTAHVFLTFCATSVVEDDNYLDVGVQRP